MNRKFWDEREMAWDALIEQDTPRSQRAFGNAAVQFRGEQPAVEGSV
jgi:hypothetical protein